MKINREEALKEYLSIFLEYGFKLSLLIAKGTSVGVFFDIWHAQVGEVRLLSMPLVGEFIVPQ